MRSILEAAAPDASATGEALYLALTQPGRSHSHERKSVSRLGGRFKVRWRPVGETKRCGLSPLPGSSTWKLGAPAGAGPRQKLPLAMRRRRQPCRSVRGTAEFPEARWRGNWRNPATRSLCAKGFVGVVALPVDGAVLWVRSDRRHPRVIDLPNGLCWIPLVEARAGQFPEYGARPLAQDRFQTKRDNPWIIRISIGVLLVLVVGLLAAYVLRPGRSPAEDAQTSAAIGNMDKAQGEADARREERRRAAALL